MQLEKFLECVKREMQLEYLLVSGRSSFIELEKVVDTTRDELGWDGITFSDFSEFSRYIQRNYPEDAETIVGHEREHACVYEKYGWDVKYGVIKTEFSFIYFPFVEAIRPDGLNDIALYKKIRAESYKTLKPGNDPLNFDEIALKIFSS